MGTVCHKHLKSWKIKPWWITSLIKGRHHQSQTVWYSARASETNKQLTGWISLRYRITLLQMPVLLPGRLFLHLRDFSLTTKLKAAFSTCSNQGLSRDIVSCVVQHVIIFIPSHKVFYYFHPLSYASIPKGKPTISRRKKTACLGLYAESRLLVLPLKRQRNTCFQPYPTLRKT